MSGVMLIGAMSRELRAGASALGLRVPHRGEVLRGPNAALVMRSGVGRSGADAACVAIRRERPAAVLHVGFAGGLRAGLAEGDLLLVTEVLDAETGARTPGASLDALRSELATLPLRLAQGSLLTVPRYLHLPADKRALRQQHEASACDMEAAPVASLCAELGIPYAGVRAISDSADRRGVRGLRDAAGWSPARFLKDLLSPATPYRAAVMLHGARRAERSLDAAVPAVLRVLSAL